MPSVTVVITAYNRAHVVERAITSALAQTFDDIEIVLVDDASQDNLPELFEKKRWPKARFIRNEVNRGIAGAKNVGIAAAQGAHIAFLDSDDAWYPRKLEKQMQALDAHPDKVPLCFTGFHVERENGLEVTRIPAKHGSWLKSALLGEMFSLGSTLLARRECFDKVGVFDEKIVRMQDRDWLLRYFECWPDLAVVQEPLVRVYNSGWPPSAVVRASMEQVVRLNSPRVARHGNDLLRLFQAGTQFEIAAIEYRNREFLRSTLRITKLLATTPAYAGYFFSRIRRKGGETDFA